jgi:hypothetical protein
MSDLRALLGDVGGDTMKDLKERELEARARLAERLKRLRAELDRRPAIGPGVPRRRPPRPRTEPEQPNWWWQR